MALKALSAVQNSLSLSHTHTFFNRANNIYKSSSSYEKTFCTAVGTYVGTIVAQFIVMIRILPFPSCLLADRALYATAAPGAENFSFIMQKGD